MLCMVFVTFSIDSYNYTQIFTYFCATQSDGINYVDQDKKGNIRKIVFCHLFFEDVYFHCAYFYAWV
ncbi:hypothetical protein SAMN05421740_107195 [Parapedobacter koreensis]|uniref:Uncharacterized protein n=1 Tax=Parapedobacter koreensis TaxID=332977 RepID=A0A1H7RM54_9SPHI|nr:hypothetical protein SAMN05421740_107195 [Parapedobacter koreensis]